MKFNKKLFQSKTIEDNDVLSYHFKEQCKIQRRINATMPHLRSLDPQPSVRIKANGAIVLNRYNHTLIPSDWVSRDSLDEDENDLICNFSNSDNQTPLPSSSSNNSSMSSNSFLSATPLFKRTSFTMIYDQSPLEPTQSLKTTYTPPPTINRSSSLPSIPSASLERYQFTYEQKICILLEEMNDVQQESVCMKEKYDVLEQKYHEQEQTLAQRDHLIQALQSQLKSFMHP